MPFVSLWRLGILCVQILLWVLSFPWRNETGHPINRLQCEMEMLESKALCASVWLPTQLSYTLSLCSTFWGLYIHLGGLSASTSTVWGNLARCIFTDHLQDIDRVESNGSFEVPDLKWISPCLGHRIRLTIDGATYERILELYSWLPRDCLFGKSSVDSSPSLFMAQCLRRSPKIWTLWCSASQLWAPKSQLFPTTFGSSEA